MVFIQEKLGSTKVVFQHSGMKSYKSAEDYD